LKYKILIERIWILAGSDTSLVKVTGNVTIRYSVYHFLFTVHRNYMSVLYRVQNIASYLAESHNFNLSYPHMYLVLSLLLLLLHPFNSLFFRTSWVSRHQKGKLFWILLEQEMMGWQWHQLHHVQIICISLQTGLSTRILQAGCPSCCPTNNAKALKVPSLG